MKSNTQNPEDRFKYVEVSVHEKICPVCGNVVQVEPALDWEAELHFVRTWTGRSVRCSGTGQRIPQGTSRIRVMVQLQGNKHE